MGFFGESWDNYSGNNTSGTPQYATDAASYWDAATTSTASSLNTFATGRYEGYCIKTSTTNATQFLLRKDSGSNDATHHFWVSYKTDAAFAGTTLGFTIGLQDGATNQCTIVFKANGDILLASGAGTGTVLSTYAGAVADNSWHSFEFEITINNTTGTFKVRKDNDSSDTHSATGLNTRGGTTNNYANRIQFSQSAVISDASGNHQYIDDLLWEYGATAGVWRGSMRCYSLPPESDVSKQFTATPNPSFIYWETTGSSTTLSRNSGATFYTSFVPLFSGTISSFVFEIVTGITGTVTAAIYASSGGSPTVPLGSGSVVNPVAPAPNVITFSPGVAVVKGTTYFLGICQNASITYLASSGAQNTAWAGTTTFASFPATNPASLGSSSLAFRSFVSGLLNTPNGGNAHYVNDPGQTGYLNVVTSPNFYTGIVSDETVGHTDFYNAKDMTVTPTAIACAILRASVIRSNSGSRQYRSRAKSGGTTVSSTAFTLTSSIKHLGHVMTVDPATSAAWTVAGINNLQIGPYVEA